MMRTLVSLAAVALLLAAAAGGVAQGADGPVLYGCVASGKISHVQRDTPPACPVGSYGIAWQGLPFATPAPTPTTPTPAPTPTPTPTPTVTGYSCVLTGPHDSCPFPGYPGVTGTISDPYVDQDLWGPVPGETQTTYANSPGDWKVVNSTPAGHGGSVTTFPDTGAPFNEAPLAGYTSIVGSFTESLPHNAQTSAWAAYDLWFNGWADEVMIQHDFTNQGPCTYAAVQQFGGSNGVPVQTWGLCTFGSERVWQLVADGTQVGDSGKTVSESSGSVDIKAMVEWLEQPGVPDGMPANSTVTNLSYGFEICSTGGQPETFTVSGYTLTAAS